MKTGLTILILAFFYSLPAQAAWQEPGFAPVLMSAPLANNPPPITGKTYYVSPQGNNSNPGTLAQPWQTIKKAMDTLTAGDGVMIRTGTYAEGDLHPVNLGTPGNYITFQAYPGEHPVINCAGFLQCIQGWNTSTTTTLRMQYVVFNGLEMRDPDHQIIGCCNSATRSDIHHIWFINGKYTKFGANNQFTFISLSLGGGPSGGGYYIVSNNEITGGRGLGVGIGHTNHAIVEFNHIHHIGQDTDDAGMIKCHRTYSCIMRYNNVHDCHRDPNSTIPDYANDGKIQGADGLYFDVPDDQSYPGARSYMYNNISHDNDSGLQFWEAIRSVTVFNNLVYNNGFGQKNPALQYFGCHGKGICLSNSSSRPAEGLEFYNNISYGNLNEGMSFGSFQKGSLVSRNNIFMNNGGAEFRLDGGTTFVEGGMDADNDILIDTAHPGTPLISYKNVPYSSLAAFKARPGNTMWVHGLEQTPGFVGPGNFHSSATSIAINRGAAVPLFNWDLENRSRPQGSAWDIGPYEFNGVVVTNRCDLNGSGSTDAVDLQVLSNAILHSDSAAAYNINRDASVDILDLQALANIVLGKAPCPS